jgi:hypothetical protein
MANAAHGDSRYSALTTYRPVTTPVWSAALGGKIYVFTADSTGKATRRVLHDEAFHDGALAALLRKYGWQSSVMMLAYRLRRLYLDRVVLEVTPVRRT